MLAELLAYVATGHPKVNSPTTGHLKVNPLAHLNICSAIFHQAALPLSFQKALLGNTTTVTTMADGMCWLSCWHMLESAGSNETPYPHPTPQYLVSYI